MEDFNPNWALLKKESDLVLHMVKDLSELHYYFSGCRMGMQRFFRIWKPACLSIGWTWCDFLLKMDSSVFIYIDNDPVVVMEDRQSCV